MTAGGYPPTNGVLPSADSRAQGEERCICDIIVQYLFV